MDKHLGKKTGTGSTQGPLPPPRQQTRSLKETVACLNEVFFLGSLGSISVLSCILVGCLSQQIKQEALTGRFHQGPWKWQVWPRTVHGGLQRRLETSSGTSWAKHVFSGAGEAEGLEKTWLVTLSQKDGCICLYWAVSAYRAASLYLPLDSHLAFASDTEH